MAAVCGTEFIQFLAVLTVFHWDYLKDRIAQGWFERKWWVRPIIQIILGRIASVARIEEILLPKQQQWPLPFLLYLSFFCAHSPTSLNLEVKTNIYLVPPPLAFTYKSHSIEIGSPNTLLYWFYMGEYCIWTEPIKKHNSASNYCTYIWWLGYTVLLVFVSLYVVDFFLSYKCIYTLAMTVWILRSL